jgi:hypothetical protein
MYSANPIRAPISSQSTGQGSPLMYSMQSPGMGFVSSQVTSEPRPGQYGSSHSPLPQVVNRTQSAGRPQSSGSSPMMTYQQVSQPQTAYKSRSLNDFNAMSPHQQQYLMQQQMVMQAQQNLFGGTIATQPPMSEVGVKFLSKNAFHHTALSRILRNMPKLIFLPGDAVQFCLLF